MQKAENIYIYALAAIFKKPSDLVKGKHLIKMLFLVFLLFLTIRLLQCNITACDVFVHQR